MTTNRITITIDVPEGVVPDVQYHHSSQPAAATPSSAAAAAPKTSTDTGTPFCSVHGIEKRADSKFGGYYCQGQDPNGPRGYCAWKWKP